MIMSLPDYYAVLEVRNGASADEIKSAYRRLARLYHPDVNQGNEDSRIRGLNEAYAVLSDPIRRATYDMQRLEERRRLVLLDVLNLQHRKEQREQRMTWKEGVQGFVRELKKELREK